MGLSKDRFNKSDYHFKDAEGKLHSGMRHSYESGKKLYDVEVHDKGKDYKTNMQSSDKTPYHKAIEEHYGLKEHELPHWKKD